MSTTPKKKSIEGQMGNKVKYNLDFEKNKIGILIEDLAIDYLTDKASRMIGTTKGNQTIHETVLAKEEKITYRGHEIVLPKGTKMSYKLSVNFYIQPSIPKSKKKEIDALFN